MSLLYHAKTLYLFTVSDFKTFLIPQVLFGIIAALSGPSLTTYPTCPTFLSMLMRAPLVCAWTWLNLLIFSLSNQRLPEAVEEDKCNKPYRPIAAGRITSEQATKLLIVLLPIAYFASEYLGGTRETSILLVLNWVNNDLRGGDSSYIVRNLILALAVPLYGTGAARVAIGSEYTLNSTMYQWSAILGAIMFFTLQVQDLKDQEGDRLRDRKTLPLVVGDAFCRYTLVPLVFFWSVFCLVFWSASIMACVMTMVLFAWFATEVLAFRDVKHDSKAYKVWALWLLSLYFLPLM